MSADELRTTIRLLKEHGEGSHDAFGMLVERHRATICLSIRRRLGSSLQSVVDIDDIFQETLLAAWQFLNKGQLAKLETVGGFRNLVAKIASNKAISNARQLTAQKRCQTRTEALGSREHELPAQQSSASAAAMRAELDMAKEQAFAALSALDRSLLDQRDNLGMSFEEIASELGCSRANAKLKHYRARERWYARIRSLSG